VPALALQLVWRRQPSWRTLPTVVVDEDRPQGLVLAASESARARRILPGMRYATAHGLAPELRATVVSPSELAAAQDELARRLHGLSPELTHELARDGGSPGTFWLGGDGMAKLYPSATAWGQAAVAVLADLGLGGVVVVGFALRHLRGGAARGRGLLKVVGRAPGSPAIRQRTTAGGAADRPARWCCATPRPPRRHTIGQLVRLPGGGLLERFGLAPTACTSVSGEAGIRWPPSRRRGRRRARVLDGRS
jgi:protein ImuB